MLEVTFIDCSPTNAVSLLTNRLKLKRFCAYRIDSKNFSKLLSLCNLQEVFEQSVGSISIQIYRRPRCTMAVHKETELFFNLLLFLLFNQTCHLQSTPLHS